MNSRELTPEELAQIVCAQKVGAVDDDTLVSFFLHNCLDWENNKEYAKAIGYLRILRPEVFRRFKQESVMIRRRNITQPAITVYFRIKNYSF